jgi:carboxylesterase
VSSARPSHPVIEGAEAWSASGGPHGVLVSHGFTGNPGSMRALAERFAAAGFAVELPRLPGHGTHVDEMLPTRWPDWSEALEAAYHDLAARVDKVVVAGLSMGGTLVAWLASRHASIAGVVAVNGLFDPANAELIPLLEAELANGEVMAGIGSDIAKPDVVETAYVGTPLRPLRSLLEAVRDEVSPALRHIRCPSLVLTSIEDHVVPPASSDHYAASVSGPVERVALSRSFHVATIDWDASLIEERAVEFAVRVTA